MNVARRTDPSAWLIAPKGGTTKAHYDTAANTDIGRRFNELRLAEELRRQSAAGAKVRRMESKR